MHINCNKYKKSSVFILILSAMIALSGCEKLNINKEDEQKYAEYMANVVLNHDIHYNAELEYVEIETETTTVWKYEPEYTTSANGGEGDTTKPNEGEEETTNYPPLVVEKDINKILNFSGINVTFKDYLVTKKYPDDNSIASMVVNGDSNLVVLRFDVANTTMEPLELNMLANNIKFKGIFNSKVKTNAQTTLLPNAFNTYMGTLEALEIKELVLIYIINEKNVPTIATIKLEIKNGDKTDTIILKK